MGNLGLQRQTAREKQMRFMYEGLSSIKEINIFEEKNFSSIDLKNRIVS